MGIQETGEAAGRPATAVGSLRRHEGGMDRFLLSLGEAWRAGRLRGLGGAVRTVRPLSWVDLPTYPFQRTSFWPRPDTGGTDVASAGLDAADHPLLGAVMKLADADGALLTGRIGLDTHPWLADHAVRRHCAAAQAQRWWSWPCARATRSAADASTNSP